jgi:hypothetical protein
VALLDVNALIALAWDSHDAAVVVLAQGRDVELLTTLRVGRC